MKVLKVKDPSEKYKVVHKLFDTPFSMIIVGKSELSGKSNFITWLLLSDNAGYKNMWDGENVYIVSPSMRTDYKLQVIKRQLDIPNGNIIDQYDEQLLNSIYEMIEDEYEEAVENKEKPKQSLIIFDDMSFGKKLKRKGSIIEKIFCNGRHNLISVITTTQAYASLLTECRENAKAMVLFDMSDRQLDRVIDDHSTMGSKVFKTMFRDVASQQKHSFLIVNYSNKNSERFLDSEFKPIDISKYKK